MGKNKEPDKNLENLEKDFKKNLKTKGLIIPIIFAIVVALFCIMISNPALNIFPSGHHDDTLTTTAPTETTEYIEDEFVQS